jgi:hypothetical protein
MVPTLEVLYRGHYRKIPGVVLKSVVQSLKRDVERMSPDRSDPKKLRRYPRYSLDVRVSIKVFRPGNPIVLWGRSIEMGQDGIGVTLTGQLEAGEVATLEVTLPASSTPLKLRALVRYRDGLRHGFEFLARDTAQQALILRTCELLSLHQ